MPRIITRLRRREAPRECFFCVENKTPSYKEYEVLKTFLTPRSKIVGGTRSGLCAKHQRRLAREVKRAREVALF